MSNVLYLGTRKKSPILVGSNPGPRDRCPKGWKMQVQKFVKGKRGTKYKKNPVRMTTRWVEKQRSVASQKELSQNPLANQKPVKKSQKKKFSDSSKQLLLTPSSSQALPELVIVVGAASLGSSDAVLDDKVSPLDISELTQKSPTKRNLRSAGTG